MPGDINQHAPLFRSAQVSDPYSLQISFVFPQDAARYTDGGFRQLVEQMVREETPAHLTAYIVWKSTDDMRVFEAAHVAWLGQWRSHYLAMFGFDESVCRRTTFPSAARGPHHRPSRNRGHVSAHRRERGSQSAQSHVRRNHQD